MSAADELREYTDQANSIHQQYLGDPALFEQYQGFIAWQLDYMLPMYADLRVSPDYAAAVDFVVSDLTGIDISQRDQDLARVVPTMTKLLPEKILAAVANAMRLNARVLQINLAICRELYRKLPAGSRITEDAYRAACQRATTLEECLELVDVIHELGLSLERIVQIPMIGFTLRTMRGPARLAGFGALQDFLERGFRTFRALDDVEQFLDDVVARMSQVFTGLFKT